MGKEHISAWDPAENLRTEEEMAAYLEAALEENDPALISAALGDIARAKGMTQIAKQTGLGRESLYKALNENAHPRFETVMKVLSALGIQIHLEPKIKFRRRRHTASLAVADKKAVYKV